MRPAAAAIVVYLTLLLILTGCGAASAPPTPTATPTPVPTETPTPNPLAGYLSLPEGWSVEEETSSLSDMDGYGDLIVEAGLENAWQAQLSTGDEGVESWRTILVYEDEPAANSAFDEVGESASESELSPLQMEEENRGLIKFFRGELGGDDPVEDIVIMWECRVLVMTVNRGEASATLTIPADQLLDSSLATAQAVPGSECE